MRKVFVFIALLLSAILLSARAYPVRDGISFPDTPHTGTACRLRCAGV